MFQPQKQIWNWSSWTRNDGLFFSFFSKCRIWGGKKKSKLQPPSAMAPSCGPRVRLHAPSKVLCSPGGRSFAEPLVLQLVLETQRHGTVQAAFHLNLLQRGRERTTIGLCIQVIVVPILSKDCWDKQQTNQSPRTAEGKGLKSAIEIVKQN